MQPTKKRLSVHQQGALAGQGRLRIRPWLILAGLLPRAEEAPNQMALSVLSFHDPAWLDPWVGGFRGDWPKHATLATGEGVARMAFVGCQVVSPQLPVLDGGVLLWALPTCLLQVPAALPCVQKPA